jgi:hypothetical protein
LIFTSDVLGHADIKTTEVYAWINAEMERKALERASKGVTSEGLRFGRLTKVCLSGLKVWADYLWEVVLEKNLHLGWLFMTRCTPCPRLCVKTVCN